MSYRCRGFFVAAWVLSLGLNAGCGPAFNAASGEDSKRTGALPVQLNTTVDDQVSRSLGDDTDWKSFELTHRSDVRIRVWWDNPGIDATLTLYNSRARELTEFRHDDDARMTEVPPLGLDAGTYFLKVEAGGGMSVYTLEVLTEQANGGAGGMKPDF